MDNACLTLDSRLPTLRKDLELLEGPRTEGGPTWTLHDPSANRFFRLGWREFSLLANWSRSLARDVLANCNRQLPMDATLVDLQKLLRFLEGNQLLLVTSQAGREQLEQRYLKTKQAWYTWLIHHYLFFRIPLVRPDKFLTRSYPYIRFMFSRAWLYLMAVVSVSGLFLVLREFDSFTNTFSYLFNIQGMLLFGVVLSFVKVAHELGHAYTCKHFGLRVPAMGVAFLVMWPMLYTDATQAWRLNDRLNRAAIAIAGVAAELMLAGIACFLWSFLPEGILKSITFIVATTTWVMSLALNLNPFMRFDGYYLLSDYFDIPNLQPRSFVLAKWWMRETLFDLGSPCPENFSQQKTMWMVCYALATWVYRLFLFIGIALLVYFMMFKVLGIILFVVEILWFIVFPIFKELKVWYQQRGEIALNRKLGLGCFGLLLLAIVVMPWRQQVAVPGVLKVDQYSSIFSPIPAQIQTIAVETGDDVNQGDLLFKLTSPALEHEIEKEKINHQMLKQQQARRGTSSRMVVGRGILESQLAESQAKLAGLHLQRENLAVRAGFSGRVVDLDIGLTKGRWVSSQDRLAMLVGGGTAHIDAHVQEEDVKKLKQDGEARFYPKQDFYDVVAAKAENFNLMDSNQLDSPYLASIYGGDIAVRKEPDGTLTPEQALYKVRLEVIDDIASYDRVVAGTVLLETEPYSIADSLWRSVAQVLIRESGF